MLELNSGDEDDETNRYSNGGDSDVIAKTIINTFPQTMCGRASDSASLLHAPKL